MTDRPAGEETEHQRLDRNLSDLQQELRIASLGVQVLFGFVLSMPFTNRFQRLTSWQHVLYLTDLVVAALAIVLLGGPVAYHRIVFRHHDKPQLVEAANRLALCGLSAVALAVTGTVLLVAAFVSSAGSAAVVTALVFGAFVLTWLLLPLRARFQAERSEAPPAPRPVSGNRARGRASP